MPGTIIKQPFDVAIVGGGIIGLIVAMGLMKRNINVKTYEQSRIFREIGAGVAFTANAIRCMGMINPDIVTALRKVTTLNGDPEKPNDYLQYVDGYSHDPEDADNMEEELLFKLYAGYKGFESCHGAHLLNQLVEFIPEGTVEFRKRLDTYVDRGEDQKLLLKFYDGTTAEVDANMFITSCPIYHMLIVSVIGCDGIKSRVRELIPGEGNQASYPHYSLKVAFRALIPMDKAEAALGSYKARNQHMHMGPGTHVLHFAVANQTLMNFVAFAPDPNEWLSDKRALMAPATKAGVAKISTDFGPTVRAIVDLLPDELDK